MYYTGGPQPQTNVEFLMDDKDIAGISVAGVVEAKKVGKTTLHARSVGHDKNGNTVIFSEVSNKINFIFSTFVLH